MTVIWKCGHRTTVERDVKTAPQCKECGERIVVRVEGATPRFTGACSGPLVSQ